jgi:hypothetical protein
MCGDRLSCCQREAVSLDEHAVIPDLGPGEETDEDEGDAE